MLLRFSDLKKNLKKDFSSLPSTRLAILGDTPTQLLHQSLRGAAYESGVNLIIYEADFNQVDLQVFDSSSDLHAFNPDFVLVFQATQKLLAHFYEVPVHDKTRFAEQHLQHVRAICDALNGSLKAKLIVSNFPEIDDQVFGSFANKTSRSFLYQLRRLNFGLMELASEIKNLFVADLASLQNRIGRQQIHSTSTYANTGIVYDVEFWPDFARTVLAIVQSVRGRIHKAVVLDLDNTLWGGVIGDDGIENIQLGDLGIGKVFSEFQAWLKQLQQRGIILCICSKNFEAVAKGAFEKHPDMILRLEDIAVFVANWENKVDNIRHIQSVLSIGFDSMVYLDDNPFERNMVRQAIPTMTIPELPEDPADYLAHLRTLNLFETASISDEDESRTRQYQEESLRAGLQKTYASEDEFLASLAMTAVAKPFDRFHVPRIAQLSQRSNQFNLRTVRYTEQDIERIANDPGYCTLYFSLADKFGDYGLISVVILKREADHLFIETWFMSCRVLKRGVERFVLNQVMQLAEKNGHGEVLGEYLPSEKNKLVEDHYRTLGFTPRDGKWVMSTRGFVEQRTFISLRNS